MGEEFGAAPSTKSRHGEVTQLRRYLYSVIGSRAVLKMEMEILGAEVIVAAACSNHRWPGGSERWGVLFSMSS